MPSFTITTNSLEGSGPIVEVEFWLPKGLREELEKRKEKIPTPIKAFGIIDTGATSCVVKPEIIQALNSHPIDQTTVQTPSCSDALGNVHILAMRFAAANSIIMDPCLVIEMPMRGQQLQCLIGRNVLKHGVLIYNGYAQTFTFSA